MKVKVFCETNEKKLEEAVNSFIAMSNVKVMDIKFTGAGFTLWPVFSVLIMYDEC